MIRIEKNGVPGSSVTIECRNREIEQNTEGGIIGWNVAMECCDGGKGARNG